MAADLARALLVGRASVEWFRVAHAGASLPPPTPGLCLQERRTPVVPVHRVERANEDVGLEVALTRSLRARPAAAVVHLGVGARGSPNVLWMADRMGSAAVAVLRSEELLCQRGDLVHSSGRRCETFDDAARCRQCCAPSNWRRPGTSAFLGRWDLLFGGLSCAAAVFVPDEADCERLATAGVPRRLLAAPADAAAIAARLLGRPAVP